MNKQHKRNIEIKATTEIKTLISEDEFSFEGILKQRDIFFKSKEGRLKLRMEFRSIENNEHNTLIQYNRGDQKGAKLSEFYLCEIENPVDLISCLERSNGILGEVKKERDLYIHKTQIVSDTLKVIKTRIHLDRVENLGRFIELEVMLGPFDTIEIGESIVNTLRKKLRIKDEDLIDCAYFDLLESKNLQKEKRSIDFELNI